jgi:hypothetical protein
VWASHPPLCAGRADIPMRRGFTPTELHLCGVGPQDFHPHIEWRWDPPDSNADVPDDNWHGTRPSHPAWWQVSVVHAPSGFLRVVKREPSRSE